MLFSPVLPPINIVIVLELENCTNAVLYTATFQKHRLPPYPITSQ